VTGTSGSTPVREAPAENDLKDSNDKANGVHARPDVSSNLIPTNDSSCEGTPEITFGEDAGFVHEKSPVAAKEVADDMFDTQTNTVAPEVVEPVVPEIAEDSIAPAATTGTTFPTAEVEEKAAAEEEHVEPPESVVADAEGSAAPQPRKRLERVARSWTAEDPSQLSVVENEFVNVWVGTDTDNGWIHAEGHEDGASAGWLPLCVLKTLPEGQKWMRAVQQWQAMDESQCSVVPGSVVVVWVGSRTQEGWTYAESEQGDEMKPGWLPVFCLAWNDE